MVSDNPRAPNQHIEDLALVVDGTPEIHPLVGELDHHLLHVHIPSVAWGSNAGAAWPAISSAWRAVSSSIMLACTSEMLQPRSATERTALPCFS
jgi:hypothetical protein